MCTASEINYSEAHAHVAGKQVVVLSRHYQILYAKVFSAFSLSARD